MDKKLKPVDRKILGELDTLVSGVTKDMNRYRFAEAGQKLYDFIWHQFADVYIEANKERYKNADTDALVVFRYVLLVSLRLLHPFMPFITEDLYQKIPGWDKTPLIISSWPKTLKHSSQS